MGKHLLVWRLAVKDIRHRPVLAALLLVAIAAGAATLTLGLALRGTTDNPYARTRAATNGPDVVATGHQRRPAGSGPARDLGASRAGPRRGRLQRALPRDVGIASDRPHEGDGRGGGAQRRALCSRSAEADAGHLGATRRSRRRGRLCGRARSARR